MVEKTLFGNSQKEKFRTSSFFLLPSSFAKKRDRTSSFFLLPSSFAKVRRAFTIVELLVVIGIIGVLLGIVTTAVTSSVKNARVRRAEAMAKALQQAISAYYAQEGRWPGAIEGKTSSMGNKSKYTFTGKEADGILQEIVRNSVGASASRPLVDASALFVADSGRLRGDGCFDNHSDSSLSSYCGKDKCINGIDFSIAANKSSKTTIPIGQMAFGWQGRQNGKFCRFWITYNSLTDSVAVTRKHPEKEYPEDWE